MKHLLHFIKTAAIMVGALITWAIYFCVAALGFYGMAYLGSVIWYYLTVRS